VWDFTSVLTFNRHIRATTTVHISRLTANLRHCAANSASHHWRRACITFVSPNWLQAERPGLDSKVGPGVSYFYEHSHNSHPKDPVRNRLGSKVDHSIHLCLYSPCGPWPLFQFPNLYTVGTTLWTEDQPVARLLPTHRTNTDIHTSSGIRTHDPSVGADEDGSCLRPHDDCDRHNYSPP
jgi:hypothetical protein